MNDIDTVEIIVEHVSSAPNSITIRREAGAPAVSLWLPKSGVEAHVGDPFHPMVSLRMSERLAREKNLLPNSA